MEINIKDLMVNHSWKMSDKEIHNSLVKMGYITDNIDFSSIQMDSLEVDSDDTNSMTNYLDTKTDHFQMKSELVLPEGKLGHVRTFAEVA